MPVQTVTLYHLNPNLHPFPPASLPPVHPFRTLLMSSPVESGMPATAMSQFVRSRMPMVIDSWGPANGPAGQKPSAESTERSLSPWRCSSRELVVKAPESLV
ncbi:unnamed protein product [Protopolystoma xenopodis]|uniref:Uncharacterized protein n=1 Tax=Protopolystoma xenopodis TaxID=117903 RepID=A0A3S5C5S1_9PLAT|nr:unnamed protein product [Protopolystoma xenopodis]